ncbi:MAG: helix-turn-helix transcriptional regulator [Comamonas sp.]|nr:helix-turn-helix transcriptional regulator [Comamonas sp.]
MMASAYARMGFSGYTSPSMACVIKEGPIIESSTPATAELISTERFNEFINHLYDAASRPEAWTTCLEVIRKQLGCNFASLVIRDTKGENEGLIVTAAGGRKDLLTHDVYAELSPFRDIPMERFMTITDLMSEAEWRECFYYKSWCRLHSVYHVMAAKIVTDDGSVYGLNLTRPESEPAFSKRDLDLGHLLMPHIRRALNMHLSLHRDRQVISLYSRATAQLMVGVVILDQNGKLLESNPAASGILDMQDGLKVSGDRLETSYANDNRKLQRLIKDALLHSLTSSSRMIEGMSVCRPSGQLNWGVVVQSISPDEWTEGKQRPSVAVFVRDTDGKADPSIRLAQQLFQLTPAETLLAIQLANGLSLEEAAEALNIRRNTARAHLRSIFSKTGVRRQTELVRIFLNSVAWLGDK